jgi:hypothetical protein
MSDSLTVGNTRPISSSVADQGAGVIEIPKPSLEALRYLEELVPEEDFRYVMFDDNLVTVSDTGKELGEFTVNIEATRYKGLECFLIHANSHGSVDGVPCGTSIVCYVTKCLETLEQQHHEYVKLDNCPLDRKTFLVRASDHYTINRVITQGKDVQRITKTVPVEQMRGFISEGSNLLLHRLLIEKPVEDDLQFISFDSDSNLCPVFYKKLHERIQKVDEVELRVYGIERTIESKSDLPTTWQSYFLMDGHLTNRVQIGSPVTMKLAKVPVQIEREEEAEKHVFEKQQLKWEEDMQLHSRFLDRKEEIKSDHATYMRHHPELRALLSDFLQFLLLRKPDDVIAFAADYFSAFSVSMPDISPYLASNVPTPFPASHTNARIDELRAPTR